VTRLVLVNTEPLVALFNRRDQWHRWTTEAMGAIPIPILDFGNAATNPAICMARKIRMGQGEISTSVGK